MAINPLPPNFANAVATFSPLGKTATGQENTENKNTTLKPVEQSAKSDRNQLRRRHQDEEDLFDPDEERQSRHRQQDIEEALDDDDGEDISEDIQRLRKKFGIAMDKAKGSIIDNSA